MCHHNLRCFTILTGAKDKPSFPFPGQGKGQHHGQIILGAQVNLCFVHLTWWKIVFIYLSNSIGEMAFNFGFARRRLQAQTPSSNTGTLVSYLIIFISYLICTIQGDSLRLNVCTMGSRNTLHCTYSTTVTALYSSAQPYRALNVCSTDNKCTDN